MPSAILEVHVRPATRADIPRIVRAATTSVADEQVAGFSSAAALSPFEDAARLEAAWHEPDLVGKERVIVAESAGRVVGYLTIEDRGEDLELVNIDVGRQDQGRGIGTRLVRYVEAHASQEGKRGVTLGTSRNAQGVPWKSLPWWQSLGYRVTHEEENAWTRSIGPGAREIRMRKEIPKETMVQLREVIDADLPVFFEYQKDPVAGRMAAFTAKDPEDRRAFLDHWSRIRRDPTVTARAVVVDGRVVGNVGSFVDPEFQRTEVTYWIDREHWGRGIATRALRALLAERKERPIYARTAADNHASIRVLAKCGFVRIGTLKGFANARAAEIEEAVFRLD